MLSRIVEAFKHRIWEVELERMSDGIFDASVPNKIWEESIKILNAAKQQLLGY